MELGNVIDLAVANRRPDDMPSLKLSLLKPIPQCNLGTMAEITLNHSFPNCDTGKKKIWATRQQKRELAF